MPNRHRVCILDRAKCEGDKATREKLANTAPPYFNAHETARFDELDGLPLASFGQRALGFFIDLALVILLWIPFELLWERFVSHEWNGRSRFAINFNFHEWRSLAAAMLYFVAANYLSNGRSIGKWIARSRVVSLARPHLGLWQCAERVLGYAVSVAEIVGFIQYFFSPNRMSMHDRIAETIVIDLRESAKPHSVR